MTELKRALEILAEERDTFEVEAALLRSYCATAVSLKELATSLFNSFAQRRHDHLAPFELAVKVAETAPGR